MVNFGQISYAFGEEHRMVSFIFLNAGRQAYGHPVAGEY
jgi:hypothetical protein